MSHMSHMAHMAYGLWPMALAYGPIAPAYTCTAPGSLFEIFDKQCEATCMALFNDGVLPVPGHILLSQPQPAHAAQRPLGLWPARVLRTIFEVQRWAMSIDVA